MMFNNEEERFSTVAELTFDELKQLLFVLRDLDESDDPIEVKNNIVVTNIDRFFPDVNMDQYLSLTYLCKNILDGEADELDFNDFKNANTELRIDKIGMSEPNPRRVWEGRIASIESVWEIASKLSDTDDTPNKIHRQVVDAKNLSPLFRMVKCEPYIFNRKLMIERMVSLGIGNKDISYWESILKKHECDYTVLNKLIQYIKNKTYEQISIFFNHFIERLELLDKDDCLENNVCVEFLENIKKISKKA